MLFIFYINYNFKICIFEKERYRQNMILGFELIDVIIYCGRKIRMLLMDVLLIMAFVLLYLNSVSIKFKRLPELLNLEVFFYIISWIIKN